MPEATISYNRRVQLEQFEPVEYGTQITFSYEEDDDFAELHAEKVAEIEDLVERELARRVAETKMANEDEDE